LENNIDCALKQNTINFQINIDEIDRIISNTDIKIFDQELNNPTFKIIKPFFTLCETQGQNQNHKDLKQKLRFFLLFKIYKIIFEHIEIEFEYHSCICKNKIFENITAESYTTKLFIIAGRHLNNTKLKECAGFVNKYAFKLHDKADTFKYLKLKFIIFLRNLLNDYFLNSAKAMNFNDKLIAKDEKRINFCVFHQSEIPSNLILTNHSSKYKKGTIKNETKLNFYNFEMSIMALEKTIFKAVESENLDQDEYGHKQFKNKYHHKVYIETDNFCEILFTIDSFFANTEENLKKSFFDYTTEIMHLFQRYFVRYKNFEKIVSSLKSKVLHHNFSSGKQAFENHNFEINFVPIYNFNIKNLERNFAKLSARNSILYNENTKNEILYFVYSINYVFLWMYIELLDKFCKKMFIHKIKFTDILKTKYDFENDIETDLQIFFRNYENEEKMYYMIQLAFYNLLSFNFKSILKISGDQKLKNEKQKDDFFNSCTTKKIRHEEIMKMKKNFEIDKMYNNVLNRKDFQMFIPDIFSKNFIYDDVDSYFDFKNREKNIICDNVDSHCDLENKGKNFLHMQKSRNN
ncbi:hypothetical protein GVAV_003004, partial [Gurleya vavrai]